MTWSPSETVVRLAVTKSEVGSERADELAVDDEVVEGDTVAAEPPSPGAVAARFAEDAQVVRPGSRPRSR
jgi:hypothetical protein